MADDISKQHAVMMAGSDPFAGYAAPVVSIDGDQIVENKGKSDGYLEHKLGKQVAYRALLGTGYSQYLVATYQNYTALHQINPNDRIFRDSGTFIYRDDNMIGRAAKRLLLPSKYRSGKLNNAQLEALRARGHKHLSNYGTLLQLAEVPRILADGSAIMNCEPGKPGCSSREMTIAGMDGISAGAWIAYGLYMRKGGKIVSNAGNSFEKMGKGYAVFHSATRLRAGANALKFAVGCAKMANEVYNYSAGQRISPSAFGDGAIDAGWGGTNFVYARFLLKESTKVKAFGDIKAATDVMSVGARAIPQRLLWGMRGIGIVSALWNGFSNGKIIYDGLTKNDLPEDEKTHLIVSGSLGVASSLASLGFAFFVTPATIPIGAIFFLISTALLIVQTIYDEWDGIKASLMSNNGFYQSFGSQFQYAFPAQQNPDLII